MFEINLIGFLLAAVLSLISTPFAIKLAVKIGAIDNPNSRKIHSAPTPRLGGLGIFFSFTFTLVVVQYFFPEANIFSLSNKLNLLLIGISLTLVLAVGICDDIRNLKPGQKFFFQLIAATLVYTSGFQISTITNPFTNELIELGIFSYPLTILWITGITNAFNLIDGLDGLASGIAAIAGLTICAISLLNNDITSAVIGIVLAGSLFGFLHFNFNPAKIFLGDSGSLFVGFSLAVLSIQSSTKGSTAFSMIIALLAVGVPIIDTLMSMLRRMLAWFLPGHAIEKSITKKLYSMFLPDKRHIHHQLLASGFSQRTTVLVLYIVSSAFGVCAVLVTAGSLNASLIVIGVVIFLVIASRKLGYNEMALFRNGILLRFYSLTILKHSVLRFCLDTFSIMAALLLSYNLTISDYSHIFFNLSIPDLLAAAVIVIVQLNAFIFGGLYKRNIVLLGVGDFLQILRVVLTAVIITTAILSFAPLPFEIPQMNIFMMLDFYFLISMVAGSRILFHALNYLFNRESADGKKVLIYGADWKGMIALHALLQSEQTKKIPIGFLDDDPELEGKFINGYPIYGGHWKLEGLLKKGMFDEIIMTKEKTEFEILKRIKRITDIYNVPIQVSKINFESLDTNYRKNKPKEAAQKTAELLLQK
ncbi:MAG: hypothetical protein A2068_03695 [Ignavibacteria bacterium GWB2_35_6b]|nr:MAG: hypothetical protein A2068_03695 [Ignavibacteria bacterium GWB2_35_6b]